MNRARLRPHSNLLQFQPQDKDSKIPLLITNTPQPDFAHGTMSSGLRGSPLIWKIGGRIEVAPFSCYQISRPTESLCAGLGTWSQCAWLDRYGIGALGPIPAWEDKIGWCQAPRAQFQHAGQGGESAHPLGPNLRIQGQKGLAPGLQSPILAGEGNAGYPILVHKAPPDPQTDSSQLIWPTGPKDWVPLP